MAIAKPVAGYLRVSQARDGMHAPELYIEEITRYCEYQRLNLAEIFSDIDHSAFRGAPQRPALSELLDRRGEFGGVVIPKLSRFGRSVSELTPLFDLFEADGIPLVFLDMNVDTSTSQGRLLRHIMVPSPSMKATSRPTTRVPTTVASLCREDLMEAERRSDMQSTRPNEAMWWFRSEPKSSATSSSTTYEASLSIASKPISPACARAIPGVVGPHRRSAGSSTTLPTPRCVRSMTTSCRRHGSRSSSVNFGIRYDRSDRAIRVSGRTGVRATWARTCSLASSSVGFAGPS